ncbi:MAG TPA: hypothetical protein PKO33_05995 [Pyrinomonadaceae bacterium]|nr:hypothetical protein [Pyrinomonadaceae bacterium]
MNKAKLFFITAVLSVCVVSGASAQTSGTYQRPDPEERRSHYLKSIFGPTALARVAATALFGTLGNRPEEWGKGPEGFGRRLASDFGKNIIKQSAMAGLDEVMKVDSRFYRSKKRDLKSKIGNALLSTVTARTPSGKRTIGVPRIAGTYISSVVAAEVWYPNRYNYRDGLRNGTISLGFNAAVNLFRELIKK